MEDAPCGVSPTGGAIIARDGVHWRIVRLDLCTVLLCL